MPNERACDSNSLGDVLNCVSVICISTRQARQPSLNLRILKSGFEFEAVAIISGERCIRWLAHCVSCMLDAIRGECVWIHTGMLALALQWVKYDPVIRRAGLVLTSQRWQRRRCAGGQYLMGRVGGEDRSGWEWSERSCRTDRELPLSFR